MASISESYMDLYKKYREQLAMLSNGWEIEQKHCKEYGTLTLEEKALVDNDMEYLGKNNIFRATGYDIDARDAETILSTLVKRSREQCGNN